MADDTYLLDANVFIEAARRYYAFDLETRFWDSLIDHADDGVVASIDRVLEELKRGKDELAEWAGGLFRDAFLSTDDEDVVESYRKVMAWVQTQDQFFDAARSEFASGADGWLVAYAMTKGFVVVTHEQPSAEAKKKVPIPNVCDAFGVRYIDTFGMLRELGVRLA